MYEIEGLGLIYSYLYIITYKKQSQMKIIISHLTSEEMSDVVKYYGIIHIDESITRHRVIHNNEIDGLRLL